VTVEFESVIERVFKVVAEAVIFICLWGVKYTFMHGNSRELKDGSKELSGESAEVERREEGERGGELASWSASSFPRIPEWPGTQIKLI